MGRYEVTFDDHGQHKTSVVLAESMASARVAARAVCAARRYKLRRIRFLGLEAKKDA